MSESEFDTLYGNNDPKAKALKGLELKGELTYFSYLYELFWGGYKRAKLLMPDKNMVRHIVDNMPYEPFGVPGMTTTVKPDDNIVKDNIVTKAKRKRKAITPKS